MNLKQNLENEIKRLEKELSAAKAYYSTLSDTPIQTPKVAQKPVKRKERAKESKPRARAGLLAESIMAVLTHEPMANGQIRNLAQARMPDTRLDAVKVYKNLTALVKQGKVTCNEVGPRQFVYSLPQVVHA